MKNLSILALGLLLAGSAWGQLQDFGLGNLGLPAIKEKHPVEAQWVSEVNSIQPGQPFWLAIHLKLEPNWHVYWKNAGDSGLPTTVEKWDLPEGFKAGELQFPYPKQIKEDDLITFGYYNEVLLPVQITPPANLEAGREIKIGGYVTWLVCQDFCIQGQTNAAITLTVKTEAPEANSKWATAFELTREKIPVTDRGWTFEGFIEPETITVRATAPAGRAPAVELASFFSYTPFATDYSAEPEWGTVGPGAFEMEIARNLKTEKVPHTLSGVLVAKQGWQGPDAHKAIAFEVALQTGPPTALGATTTKLPIESSTVVPAPDKKESFILTIFLAFLAGIILNLMPCVFPILSIKVLSFVKQAQDEKTKPWHHGLYFTAGVLVSFWILVAILLSVRGSSQAIWGFHLQSPILIIILCLIFFLFALNLFGVFEFGESLTGVGTNLMHKGGWVGSFFSGFLATVVATPCSGPFMAGALGFALSQPNHVAFIIFTSLALGMALPFLLLTCFPGLIKRVPKPGPWMITLKQFLGFLLMATAVWMLAILRDLVKQDILIPMMTTFLILGFGVWILGRWGEVSRKPAVRIRARIAALVLFGLGVSYTVHAVYAEEKEWEPWSAERVQELREEGKGVFIDFTATWCAICQVNKPFMKSERTLKAFKEKGVVPLVADNTQGDPKIDKILNDFNRPGVPLYLLYPADPNLPPVILPQNLTVGIILDALEKI